MRTAMLVMLVLAMVGCSSGVAARGEREATQTGHGSPTAIAPAGRGSWQAVGLSVRGRAIEAATVGRGGRRVLVVGGIHGDEHEMAEAVETLRRHLVVFEPAATVRLMRDLNPDGSAAGTRGNANGVDLNRNWPARSFRAAGAHGQGPLSEPESRVLAAEIEQFGPDVIVVCHSARNGPFVNFDGPAAGLAERFAAAARATDHRWRVQAEMGYVTPGSLGSYIGVDRGLPILTIEFARGHDAELAKMALVDGVEAVIAATAGLAK